MGTTRPRALQRRRAIAAGFTLLELIVTLMILAILARLAVPTYQRVKDNTARSSLISGAAAIARSADAAASSRPPLGQVGDTDDLDIEQAVASATLSGVFDGPDIDSLPDRDGPYGWDAGTNTLSFSPGSRCFEVTILVDHDGDGVGDSTGLSPGPVDSIDDRAVVSASAPCA